ncbi:MAG: diaminopimelate epimerase [Thermincolia bacterium]
MKFTKVQGLGNDFVLVNCLEEGNIPAGTDLEQLSIKVCDRHFGIGADGLVLVLPSKTADIRMRIFNSDGSEPEMCGNAIRCFAKYVYEQGIVNKEIIQVETLGGLRIPQLIKENGEISTVRVDMGEPELERGNIPMTGPVGWVVNEALQVGGQTFQVTCVSMGNPHCVIFVPDVDKIPLSDVGPKIESHFVFPRKTNTEFIQVLSDNEVKMRVWERGAAETLACGTGACATVVAAVLNGKTGRKVTVHLAGGDLLIEWAEDNHVYMTGPAENVFSGKFIS